MIPIRVRFGRVKNVLLAQVLSMDECLRGSLNYEYCHVNIKSADRPAFYVADTLSTLYLRGTDRTRDNNIICYQYTTEAEAMEALTSFVQCIRAYNSKFCDLDKFEEEIKWEIAI